MKLSKDELKNKVNELVQDNDVAIQLLEDIEDSMESGEIDNSELEALQAKFDELQTKYRERFIKGDEEKEVDEKKEESEDGMEEKEIIDVKEI